ncbi:MAG: ribosome biogenesis GTPase Der [Candidatus Peregrinibacteria bacterium]
MPAIVAIVGRPNVGKSTLFNRALGERRAIESDVAGTTRDTITALYEGEKVDFLLVDTGGLEFEETGGSIESDTQVQARLAASEADLILFCIDTKEELTRNDYETAQLLRKQKKPVFLVGTKADSGNRAEDFPEIFSLAVGDGDPFFISAAHNRGVQGLLDAIETHLEKRSFQKRFKHDDDSTAPIRLAFLGRPNAGKSSLVNAILGKDECIVSDIPGTTRDSKHTEISRDGQEFSLIDTAGIRQRSNISDRLEKYAVMRSFQAIAECDIALYILDAKEGVTAQDLRILGEIQNMYTGVILIINKWDTQEKGQEEQAKFLNYLHREIQFLPWAPVLFVSALNKKNIPQIFPLAKNVFLERQKRIGTGELNAFLKEAQHLHTPAGTKNTRPRIKYGTQVEVSPPHFIFFGAQLSLIHFSYKRYLEHRIRDAFGFDGTGIKMEYRTADKNPYAKKKEK